MCQTSHQEVIPINVKAVLFFFVTFICVDHTSRNRSLFYRDSVDTGNIAETVSYVLMLYSRSYFITVRLAYSRFYLISDIMRNVL